MSPSHPALTLTMLGSGGATPYAQRVNPSVAVRTLRGTVLYDAGAGISLRLSQAGISPASIDLICLTHLHADHVVELPLIVLASFLEGRTAPIVVSAPPGTRDYLDTIFGRLYAYVPDLIKNITGASDLLHVTELWSGEVPCEVVDVTCARVSHGDVPALGYRQESHGRIVAVSGDTSPCDAVVELARGADLLVHECPFPPEMGQTPGHTTPEDVGKIASRAGVRKVVLTHLFAETVGREADILSAVRQGFAGDCIVGEDLMAFQFSPLS